jgi:hypothetical protein
VSRHSPLGQSDPFNYYAYTDALLDKNKQIIAVAYITCLHLIPSRSNYSETSKQIL